MTPPELIARENIPLIWPLIEPKLFKAMERMQFIEYDTPYVFDLLSVGDAQLWVGGQGEMIAITHIGNYPGVKRLIIDFIGGSNYNDYREHMEYIEHWAITLGATEAEAEIRPGLIKTAREEGWRRPRIKMFKKLERGLH